MYKLKGEFAPNFNIDLEVNLNNWNFSINNLFFFIFKLFF